MLPRQGSNLDSSDPESDVLPVTPRGNEFAENVLIYETGVRKASSILYFSTIAHHAKITYIKNPKK